MPITMAKLGETLEIKRITGKDDVRAHLAEMGFVVGTVVTVVSTSSGNVILQVKDSRVALGEELARRLIV